LAAASIAHRWNALPSSPRFNERARELASLLDFELGEASVGGASDGNFVAHWGVPVLDGLGIEGDGAHAAHEHITVDNIARQGAVLSDSLRPYERGQNRLR